MNVAFDATAMLANMSKDGEDGAWVCKTIQVLMSDICKDNSFFCLNLYNESIEGIMEKGHLNYKEINYYSGNHIEILRMPEYKSVLKKIIVNFIRQYKIDIFIITSIFDRVLTVYEEEWFEGVATVALVHNIDALVHKDLYFTSYSVQKRYYEQLHVLQWVDKCITKSSDIKSNMVRVLDFKQDKIIDYKDLTEQDIITVGIEKKKITKCSSRQLRKIAFFTPLPPIESGIAYYSYHILIEIAKYLDVDVFIDNGYEVDCKLPSNVKIYRHYEFINHFREYDEIVYQVGNNEYHSYIFDYIKEFSGIVDMHDYNLHHILAFLYGGRVGQNFINYKEALKEDMTESDVLKYLNRNYSRHTSGDISEVIINGFVVNYAKKIIVHNRFAKRGLLNKNILRNVSVIPLYVETKKLQTKRQSKESIIFSSFGFLSPSKRVVPMLQAFEKIVEEGYDVKLLLVGELNPVLVSDFERYALKDNLKDRISATGYVSEKEFEDYLSACDIGISLRYPYCGETSGPLTRLMGMGKCVIINDIGSFSEIPDEVCLKIPSVEKMSAAEEVKALISAMKRALNEDERSRIGMGAYKYIEENMRIDVIGKKYVDEISHIDREMLSNGELKKLLFQE